MFLRGYGNQDYSQYNVNYLSDNGIIPWKKTNTNYQSGDVGKVQGDSVRLNIYGTPYFFVLGVNKNPTMHNVSHAADGSWNDFYYNGYNKFSDGTIFSGGRYETSCLNGVIQYPVNLRHYKYSIGEMSPCGIASIREDIVGPMNGEVYPIETSLVSYGWSNCLSNAIANENRPVNIAVRYYIKAK